MTQAEFDVIKHLLDFGDVNAFGTEGGNVYVLTQSGVIKLMKEIEALKYKLN